MAVTESSHETCFLTLIFVLLAMFFDKIWNSMEQFVNLDDNWRKLLKTFDIWVELYLILFVDI